MEKAKRILEANGFRFQVIYIDYEASSALMHNVEILNALTTSSKNKITQTQMQVIEADVGDGISSLGHVAKLVGLTIHEAPMLVLHERSLRRHFGGIPRFTHTCPSRAW
ncbi:hypothetical protein LP419_21920 [Massilia sp. H-1]|nr:hypothetical protein LP419_21920 [Massilia sp. H-1]